MAFALLSRHTGLRTKLPLIAATLLLSGLLLALVETAPARAGVPASVGAARLKHGVVALAQPNHSARRVARISATTPYTGSTTVVPVLSQTVDSSGRQWLRVSLPTRPNGSTGWIPSNAVTQLSISWRLSVSISQRRVTVYRNGAVVRSYLAVVGAPSTPTPRGTFFVVDRIRLYNNWANGVWALALSAYSNILKHFDGGNGEVAVHGKGALPDPLGSAASHGCVRLANSATAWLAHVVPIGTPIDIGG